MHWRNRNCVLGRLEVQHLQEEARRRDFCQIILGTCFVMFYEWLSNIEYGDDAWPTLQWKRRIGTRLMLMPACRINCAPNCHILGNAIMASMEVCLCFCLLFWCCVFEAYYSLSVKQENVDLLLCYIFVYLPAVVLIAYIFCTNSFLTFTFLGVAIEYCVLCNSIV